MSNQFFPAPEVAAVGEQIVAEHHYHLTIEDGYSNPVRIEYLFCTETPERNGKETWGTARKVSGYASFVKRRDEMNWAPKLTEEEIASIEDEDARADAVATANWERKVKIGNANTAFFLITISKPIWDFLDEDQRRALVDHELMHCGAEIDDHARLKLYLKPHDYEAFDAEVERYGLWRGDANHHYRAMKKGEQREFDFGDEDASVTFQTSHDGKLSEPVTVRSGDLSKFDAMLSNQEEGT